MYWIIFQLQMEARAAPRDHFRGRAFLPSRLTGHPLCAATAFAPLPLFQQLIFSKNLTCLRCKRIRVLLDLMTRHLLNTGIVRFCDYQIMWLIAFCDCFAKSRLCRDCHSAYWIMWLIGFCDYFILVPWYSRKRILWLSPYDIHSCRKRILWLFCSGPKWVTIDNPKTFIPVENGYYDYFASAPG